MSTSIHHQETITNQPSLSITEWRPVTGSLPPMNDADWESEFLKYKASPEFKQLNSQMTLDEFKKIYFMEWFHRLWGRVIGLTFVIPTVYFIARRKVTPSVAVKLVGICALIGFQGFLGWWMVKSGLKDDLFAEGSHPRVSQYRLAAHLGTAFVVYCSMLQTGLAIIKEYHLVSNPQGSAAWVGTMLSPAIRRYRRTVVGLFLLAFTTAMSGALVAGLDAGLIYNEFPKMGLGLTPPKKELFDPFYSHVPDQSDLWWRNMLENPSLVQLDHRILAMTTFTAVLSFAAWTRFSKPLQTHLNPHARQAAYLMARVVVLQATLGIGTLIYMVPTWLAAAHQAGALLLLTSTVILYNRIAIPRRAIIRQVNIKPPGPESVSAPVFYRTPTPPVKPTPLKPKFKTR